MKEIVVITSEGLEQALAAEIEELTGIAPEPIYLGARLFVSERDFLRTVYQLNYELRSAIRVLIPIKKFSALTAPMLYSQVKRVHWEDYLSPEMTLSVKAVFGRMKMPTEGKGIIHSAFAGQKIKDGVVDRLREMFGSRPNVDKESPDVKIHAFFDGGYCQIALDSSGESLHERGYKRAPHFAPIKEHCAAGLLKMAGLKRLDQMPKDDEMARPQFWDPMCGSGTIAIEAAMIMLGIPSQKHRRVFGFMNWKGYDEALFRSVVVEAKKKEMKPPKGFRILASDISSKDCDATKKNLATAGLDSVVEVSKGDFFSAHPSSSAIPKFVFMNPPYGERLETPVEVRDFYKKIGDSLKQNLKGTTAGVLASGADAVKSIGLRTKKKINFMNGPIECKLMVFDLY